LGILDRYRPLFIRGAQLLNALLHDPYGLPHLLHADAVPVVAVAVLAHWNIEIHLGVALVGLSLAQIPCRTRAAHHHARKSPLPRFLQLDHTNIDVALLEDAIPRE